METAEKHLQAAVAFFKPGTDIARITVADIEAYVEHLELTSNGRGGTLSGASIT